MESYAMSLAGTLVQLGHRVVFHAHDYTLEGI